jgi:hypothetical protein
MTERLSERIQKGPTEFSAAFRTLAGGNVRMALPIIGETQ